MRQGSTGTIQSGWVLAILLAVCCLLRAQVPPFPSTGQGTGEQLYKAACAACHGQDGRGEAPDRVGFDIPLPDFTDCAFASREPDADWLAVAHQGGLVRAFSKMMPAFGEALSVPELNRILTHIRSMCRDSSWPRGELNLPRPLVTEKAYPEDEAVLTTEFSTEGRGALINEIVYEKRFGARNQLEFVVPFGWRETDRGAWVAGIGDVGVAAKRALYHDLAQGTIFSVAAEVVLPSGEEEDGFGKGTVVLEPFAAYGQILPRDFFLHAQGGFELPTDTEKSEREAFWRLALGRSFSQGDWGRSWSPMIEVLATKELVSGESINWDLLPQFQVTLNRRQHIMLNIGVRLPVTDSRDRDTRVLVYLLWDWFDGGFFDGW